MADEGFKRKLTAVLSSDVEVYSHLIQDDEDSTIHTLTNYRAAMSNLIQKFRGHVVDATSDNLLAEFTSVVDAVNCAAETQREHAE
jgi:adenylate cyclase